MMNPDQLVEYRSKISEMDKPTLKEELRSELHSAAFNRNYCIHDQRCSEIYSVCHDRGDDALYAATHRLFEKEATA